MVMLVPNLNLSMLLSQYAETMMPMYEIMQIPLDSYEDLLFVQERLAIYYCMLGEISAAFLRPTRHRVVSAIYGAPIIYNWKQASDTAIQGIV